MKFNRHYQQQGKHALLSASKYYWINYDDEKIKDFYYSSMATEKGTQLHSLAEQLITLGVNLPKKKTTLNMHVNDAIGYGMTAEQCLYFSDNCFGTADAISFKNNLLRIHDLKTGVTPAHMEQLLIYAGLFCLEYGMEIDMSKFKCELRIYQNDEVTVYKPEVEEVLEVMEKIQRFDEIVESLKGE